MSALIILYFKFGKFCVTLNSLSVTGRIKKVIKLRSMSYMKILVWRLFLCMGIGVWRT